jgi:hypothetical protein
MTAIGYFTRTDTVHIATELRDGDEVVTPIWAVVVDGVPYIRSGYGAGSRWYRRVQRTGRAAFIDGPHRYPVTVENLNDEAVNARVDEAYRAKTPARARRCARPSHRRCAPARCESPHVHAEPQGKTQGPGADGVRITGGRTWSATRCCRPDP